MKLLSACIMASYGDHYYSNIHTLGRYLTSPYSSSPHVGTIQCRIDMGDQFSGVGNPA